VRARFLDASAFGLLHFARTPLPMLEMLSRTPRPGTRTSVSETPYFVGGSRATTAMHWRDVFLRGALPPPGASDEVRAVVGWARDCSGPLPLQPLLELAQEMIPELSPGELDAVWRQFETTRCAPQFTERDRAWLAFLRACGERDGKATYAAARLLLESETALRPASARYLVAAGMLGAIASGDPASAHALWEAHKERLSRVDDLLLRTLLASSQP
jgi:hypothetical protein